MSEPLNLTLEAETLERSLQAILQDADKEIIDAEERLANLLKVKESIQLQMLRLSEWHKKV